MNVIVTIHLEVVVPLPQGIEPDERADDEYRDSIRDECPIQDDESKGYVIPLHDCEDRYEERHQQQDS